MEKQLAEHIIKLCENYNKNHSPSESTNLECRIYEDYDEGSTGVCFETVGEAEDALRLYAYDRGTRAMNLFDMIWETGEMKIDQLGKGVILH